MKKLNEKAMQELMESVSSLIDAGIDFVPVVVFSPGQKAALNSMAAQSLHKLQEMCAEESTGADDEVMFELTMLPGDDDPASVAKDSSQSH